MNKKLTLFFSIFSFFLYPHLVFSQMSTIEVSGVYVVKISFGSFSDASNNIRRVAVGRSDLVDVSFERNGILLQALVDDFPPTNLIVDLFCNDSKSFKLIYKNEPSKFVFEEDGCSKEAEASVSVTKTIRVHEVKYPLYSSFKGNQEQEKNDDKKSDDEIIEEVKERKNYFSSIGVINHKYSMDVFLNGIWLHEKFFYIKVTFMNKSNLSYVIDGSEFSLTNKKKSKKTTKVRRSLTQYIRYNSGDLTVKAKNSLVVVFKIEKIAITPDKKLVFDVWESTPGERKFSIDVSSETLLRVRSL